MGIRRRVNLISYLSVLISVLLFVIGCKSVNDALVATLPATDAPINSTANGYPILATQESLPEGYPVPTSYFSDALSEPPDPERVLPEAEATTGVVGGVLIWDVTDAGFLPLEPKSFILAEVVKNSKDEPAMIRTSANSPKAELFPTGVFVFQGISPGNYGLVVDLGHTQFPVLSEIGEPLIITVEAGKGIDLGQLITKLPGT